VTSLVARGYVTRRALAGDARSAYLELTPEGRAKLEAVSRALEERDREIHATLQPAEAEQLAALLTRVRKGADHFAADEERLEKQQRKSAPSPAPD
jgi:DNA-binding MarR family transcriptional regulator